MILYWIVLNNLYISFRTYFRRIYLINVGSIPPQKAVILAANHGSAFLDGVLLSVLLRRKVYVYVRGDIFKKKWANTVLRSLRLLPIYRTQDIDDRIAQSSYNKKTLGESVGILKKKNGTLVIFPEGNCVSEQRLRPMKNGVIRLCLEILEKNPQIDIDVVPVGINYSNPGQFRQEVCINFGSPISIKKIKELSETHSNSELIKEFNNDLYNAIEQEMVIIKDKSNDIIAAQYLSMARNQFKESFFGFFKKNKKRFIVEKRAANDINNISENNQEKFELFRKKITNYSNDLKEVKINDKLLSLNFAEKTFYILFTILLCVPSVVGFIVNYPRVFFTNYITSTKVKKAEFVDSVIFGVGSISGILYFVILVLILIPFFGYNAIYIALLLRLLGYLFWFWKESAIITLDIFRINFTSKGRNIIKALKSQRNFILNFFE